MNLIKKDLVSTGAIIGLLLPILFAGGFILYSSSRFESVIACIKHFQQIGLLYKIISLSLMPGTGLFFLWTKFDKLNQARGVLLMSLFYGIVVLILYMT